MCIHTNAYECGGPLQGAHSAFEEHILMTVKITLPFTSPESYIEAETILHPGTADLKCISEEIKLHSDVDTHVLH